LGIDNGLSTTTAFSITNSGSSVETFNLNGFNQTLASLATSAGGSITNSIITNSGAPKTLTISNSSGSTTYAGLISGNIALTKSGASTQILSGANTYTGVTTISGGSLALGAAGSINNSSRISIDAGGTFDVSLIPSYTLSASTGLSAGGAASPADIKGGTTVDFGSQPITLTHDGVNPPLTVSQGALTLNGNSFIVSSTSPLASGSYILIQQASGSITQSGSSTVAGPALSGSTAALDFSDSSAVKLTVVEAPVSNSNSTLTATPATLVADNTSTSTVTLTLKDASNVALPNVGVNWSLSGTGNTVSVAENYGTTNGSGVFTFTVKSVTGGTKTLTFTVGSQTFTTNIDFTVPPVGYTLAWDPALTTTGSDGAGPWNLTTANWANSGANILWPNNGNDNAVLGTGSTLAASNNITLGTPINVANITFNTGGVGTSPQYQISGQTLTLSDSTIDVPASALISSTLAGSGFTKAGVGTLRLDGNSPAYAGDIALNAGTLQLGNNSPTGDLGTGTITLDGDAVFQVRTQAALTLNNTIAGSTTGPVGFQLNGGTTVTVAKSNTYTAAGGTYLQPTGANRQGILKLGIADGLPTTTAFSINLDGTSLQTFDLAGFNQTLASLAGSGTATTAVITSTAGAPTLTVSGNDTTTFDGLVSGTLSVSKGGSGSQTLSAANTYSGDTTVTEGTLVLNNPNANNESSTVSLAASGATLELNFDESEGAVTDTVDKLFIGGVQQIAGVYKAADNITDSGTPIAQITGPGTLTVNSSPVVSTPYDTWATSKGLTGANNAKDLDPDNDGRNNLAEFAFNGDPLSGSDNGKVYGLTEDSDFDGDTTKELILTVAVRTGTPAFAGTPSPSAAFTADGITYTIEGSLNLSGFLTPVNVVPTPVITGLPPAGAGYEYRSFSLDGSNGLNGKGFLRAKVTSP
jgi:autotransporter-associated beta strand protein